MSNRYYTVMIVPERTSRVKKWVISRKIVLWASGVAGFLVLLGIFTSIFSLRYIARHGEFDEALLRNQYLEGQIKNLQNQMGSLDATMVRIQNFEQKLRVLARLETKSTPAGGIGPLTPEDQEVQTGLESASDVVKMASLQKVPTDYIYRMRSLELSIDDLGSRATLQEQSLQEVYELLKDQQSVLSSTPSIWPSQGFISSEFGYRVSPFTGLRQLHEGLDIAAPWGAKVEAPADGIVSFVGTDAGYGKVVVINHGYGLVTRFGHNSDIIARTGQRVSRGDIIALVGATGRTTGPHLHYEVRLNGVPVNPTRYILN